jgi:hypothetical protein
MKCQDIILRLQPLVTHEQHSRGNSPRTHYPTQGQKAEQYDDGLSKRWLDSEGSTRSVEQWILRGGTGA